MIEAASYRGGCLATRDVPLPIQPVVLSTAGLGMNEKEVRMTEVDGNSCKFRIEPKLTDVSAFTNVGFGAFYRVKYELSPGPQCRYSGKAIMAFRGT